jgi:hypothetical protein
MKTMIGAALAFASLVLAMPAAAKPSDCSASLAVVETAVSGNCDCAGSATHGKFVRCAVKVVKGLATDGLIPHSCRGDFVHGFARSTCGKSSAFTTCCVAHGANTTCLVKHTAACERVGGTPGNGSTCLDACLPASPSGAFVD